MCDTLHENMYVYVCMYVCICMCVCVCMYMYVCVCMFAVCMCVGQRSVAGIFLNCPPYLFFALPLYAVWCVYVCVWCV